MVVGDIVCDIVHTVFENRRLRQYCIIFWNIRGIPFRHINYYSITPANKLYTTLLYIMFLKKNSNFTKNSTPINDTNISLSTFFKN